MKQLAVVQARVDARDYVSEEAFRRKVYRLLEMVRERADPDPSLPLLVAFPEDIGTPCAFLGEKELIEREQTLAGAIRYMLRRRYRPALWRRIRHRVSWIRALFLLQADLIARTYITTFSRAARDFRAYLVAGSTVLPELDSGEQAPPAAVYNVSYVFDPQGRVIGRQQKVHLTEIEERGALDLTPGDLEKLRVVDTPVGRLGVAICYDGFFDDVRSRLLAQGAQVLVQPSANPGVWSVEQQIDWLNGAWKATLPPGEPASLPAREIPEADRENAGVPPSTGFQLALNPMLVGRLFDLEFQGQSSIIRSHGEFAGHVRDGCPSYQGCPGRPGFVRVAASPTEEEVLVARIE